MESKDLNEISRVRVGSAPHRQTLGGRPELPFRLLLISDLTPHARRSSSGLNATSLQSVDRQTFAALMHGLSPRLFLEVPDHVNEEPGELELRLTFPDMRAFRPEGIVAQVPALAKLLQIRTLVGQVKDGGMDLAVFRASLQAAGVDEERAKRLSEALRTNPKSVPPRSAPEEVAPRQSSDEGRLGSLLDMVDLGTGEATDTPTARNEGPPTVEAMDALLRAVDGASARPSARRAVAEAIIRDIDHRLTDQVNAILHTPKFQRLEAAWRGLAFLVDRLDFRRNVRLDVLPAGREDLAEVVRTEVIGPELDRGSPVPLSAIILDYQFDSTAGDVQCLDDLAKMGSAIHTPMIASPSASFFGVRSAAGLADLPVLWQHLERPEYVAWNALRDKQVSNYLALVLPRFLLRYAYGPDDPVKGFEFTESGPGATDRQLWGNGSLAIATALARSHVSTGWPTRITGAQDGGRIENLPVWKSRCGRIPLDVLLPESKQVEFSEAGFVVLGTRPDEDVACVRFAPTAHRPDRYDDDDSTVEARLHASLPCRLFASIIAHHVSVLQGELAPGLTATQIQEEFTGRLRGLLKFGGVAIRPDSVATEVSDNPDRSDRYRIMVRLIPPAQILGRETRLVLGLESRR